jgi:magnesium transporter
MTVDEAVSFLRRDARDRAQMTYYAYVTDSEEKLLGVVSFRDLLITSGDRKVRDVMHTDVITAPENVGPAELVGLFSRYNLQIIPLLDSEKRIKSVVTKEEIGGAQRRA